MKRYVVQFGHKEFDYTLKELHEFNLSEYLCKRVIIEYWKTIDVEDEDSTEMDDYFVFEGVISCISSKGQLRLQYIDILSPKSIELQHKYLPNPFYHSYWFAFKLIRKVYLIENENNAHAQQQDITTKLLNIMKFKIAQSFIFYCGQYEGNDNIEDFGKKNIKKFIHQNYNFNEKNDSDKRDQIDIKSMKFFIKYKLKSVVNNRIGLDVESFLNDMNRSNAHILFSEKPLSRNNQRSLMKFHAKTLLIVVRNYILLWDDWIKGVEGNSFQRRRKKFVKNKKDAYEPKESDQWDDYIQWDQREVDSDAEDFDYIYVDLETDVDELYNTASFEESGWLNNLRDARRIGYVSKYWPNRRKSQRIDHYWKYIHSREYLNNQIYVNTKTVATFDKYTRRNAKKRCKYKKYNRKIARSQMFKQTRIEQAIVKRDLLLQRTLTYPE